MSMLERQSLSSVVVSSSGGGDEEGERELGRLFTGRGGVSE